MGDQGAGQISLSHSLAETEDFQDVTLFKPLIHLPVEALLKYSPRDLLEPCFPTEDQSVTTSVLCCQPHLQGN